MTLEKKYFIKEYVNLHSFGLNLIKIFICVFFLLETSHAGSFEFEDQIIAHCKGQEIFYASDFPNDLSEYKPHHFPRLYLDLMGSAEIRNKFIKEYASRTDPNKLTKVERIFSAMSLMTKRSKNFNQMEELLDFKTESNDLNSYRLAHLSEVKNLKGKRKLGIPYKLAKKAYEIRTELDPFLYQILLYNYLNNLDMNINISDEETKYVFGEVKKFKEDNPLKWIFKASIRNFQTNYAYDNTTLNLYKEAYLQCPYFDTIYEYAIALPSEELLTEIIYNDPHYLPQVDLAMAEIYVRFNDYETAKNFFERAKEAKPYFLGMSNSMFNYIESALNSHKNKNKKNRYTFWIFILIASFASMFFLIWWILHE